MNWLAHLYLAQHSDAAMLGALLGDFAAGTTGLDRYGAVEHSEILLHRRIDRFTDTHPAVVELRGLFPDGRRRFAGIALDMYFDHVLAREWPCWSDVPLDRFAARAYRIVESRHAELPPRLQAIAPALIAQDWLGSYRHRDSIDGALRRIARRLSRNGDRLVACLDDLRHAEAEVEDGFQAFFPELVAFVGRARRDPGPCPRSCTGSIADAS